MPYGHVISKALIIEMDKAYMDENYTYIVRCADAHFTPAGQMT